MVSTNIGVFRKLLRRAIFITQTEGELFDRIPDAVLQGIFEHNFNGNLKLAERVLLNRHKEVDRVDRARLEQNKLGIANLNKAATRIFKSLKAGENVLFITDADNDGSLAQSILLEFLKTLPHDLRQLVHIEYAQPLSHTHGLTKEIVDISFEARGWGAGEKVLVVTADNGINNRADVEGIIASYSNTDIIITDHHLPRADLVVQENKRTIIFNPKYKPTEYFRKKNISGANTLGVLLRAVNSQLIADEEINVEDNADNQIALANIDELGSWANLLDYANADIADMPIRPYIVEKALSLRPLLNVSNSMRNLVTGNFTDQDYDDIALASHNLSSTHRVAASWIKEKVEHVKLLNETAQRLLNLYTAYTISDNTLPLTKEDFYSALTEELSNTTNMYQSVNPNFIEQLRPIIFNLAAIDNKNIFLATLGDTMVQVFNDLRTIEYEIQTELRGAGLLNSEKRANSTILYPVDASVTKIFNRKLLAKVYNEDNNGFLLMLNDVTELEARGSMRSLYPITKLLEDKSEIEDQLNITVNFQGHEMAAGFFINSTDGKPLNEQRLADFNAWMDDRVAEMKIAERSNLLPTLEVDFASVGLIEKINRAIKANLAGMWGIPAVLSLSADRRHGVWITDNNTSEQINVDALLDRKKFGYQAIKTDFHDGAIVVPIELLRTVSDSGFEKALRLSYMDEGVFMASQVVTKDHLPRLVDLKGGKGAQEDLIDYYKHTYRKSNFIDITRDDIKQLPYFKFNRYGNSEFESFESLIIEMLDISQSDVLAVIDTEGTGLGKAPKCFNIGGTNLTIEAGSGQKMNVDEFEERYFRNETGNEFLLTPEQMVRLERLHEGERTETDAIVLHNISLELGVAYHERFLFEGKADELLRVSNVKKIDDEVIYNRRITGSAFSYLIKNDDFAITQELENLTGISNWMIDEVGRPAHEVDAEMTAYYRNLKNENGEAAKIIFQAHNMPYDRGVSLANFQQLNEFVATQVTSDTAKIARKAKLAYDDTPVASFELREFGRPTPYFYDSPYSDYSITTFLELAAQGKSGVFADTKAKLLLRYNAETQRFSLIDRVAKQEVMISANMEKILESKVVSQAPNTEIKYSVEQLSRRAMIRNILLLDKRPLVKVELKKTEEPFRAALELYQDKYHFDITPERNIAHFADSLWNSDPKNRNLLGEVNLGDLTRRFLEANKETQARFHDGWIYAKVLNIYEPDAKSVRVPAEIIEEINYFTDLPTFKIRKVLDDVIRFKRHFNIEHALVHEQHNNIRQHSEDGQGLADTAYESVLPQFLAMMKFFNPYYHSVTPAAQELVETNIRGSMIQTLMGDDFTNEIASDSFSMIQMLAFDREGKTDLIKKAEAMAKEGLDPDGTPSTIKFKLGSTTLPPHSGIYAKPLKPLDREQIMADSEKLAFIVINEQIKLSGGGRELAEIVAANDAKSIEYRDDLLTRYSHVEFSRHETRIKKLQQIVCEAYEGHFEKFPPSLATVMDDEMTEIARDMIRKFGEIYHRTGLEYAPASVHTLKDMLDHVNKNSNVVKERSLERVFKKESVRQANFLPEFDAKRQQPMKFALENLGVNFCAPFMKKAEEKAAQEEKNTSENKSYGLVRTPSP